MKKKIVLFIFGLVIVAALIVASCFSFTVSQRMAIDAPLDIVAPQVSGFQNWKRWYGEGVERLVVVGGGPVSMVVRDTARSFEEAVSVVPAMDGRSSEIIWSRPMTIWQGISGPGNAEMLQHIAAFKSYIENPQHYYGFDIHIRPVTDTLFAVKEARVDESEVATKRPELLQVLRNYLHAHPIGRTDSVISGYEPVSGGRVHLVVGIPVGGRDRQVEGIRFLALPRGGRLLSGECDSVHLTELRQAMDRFMADKRLQLVAIPFTEQALDGGGGYELNYPIW